MPRNYLLHTVADLQHYWATIYSASGVDGIVTAFQFIVCSHRSEMAIWPFLTYFKLDGKLRTIFDWQSVEKEFRNGRLPLAENQSVAESNSLMPPPVQWPFGWRWPPFVGQPIAVAYAVCFCWQRWRIVGVVRQWGGKGGWTESKFAVHCDGVGQLWRSGILQDLIALPGIQDYSNAPSLIEFAADSSCRFVLIETRHGRDGAGGRAIRRRPLWRTSRGGSGRGLEK